MSSSMFTKKKSSRMSNAGIQPLITCSLTTKDAHPRRRESSLGRSRSPPSFRGRATLAIQEPPRDGLSIDKTLIERIGDLLDHDWFGAEITKLRRKRRSASRAANEKSLIRFSAKSAADQSAALPVVGQNGGRESGGR